MNASACAGEKRRPANCRLAPNPLITLPGGGAGVSVVSARAEIPFASTCNGSAQHRSGEKRAQARNGDVFVSIVQCRAGVGVSP